MSYKRKLHTLADVASLMNRSYCRITPALSDCATKHSRATAYRLIRHMLVNPQSVEKLQQQSLDWYIVKYAH